jgi:SAM-dependent methyltransferase
VLSGDRPVRQLFEEFGLGADDVAACEQSGLSENALSGWRADRVARRPTGARAREVYGADDVHKFARRAILEALALQPTDRLLEIGCGGGLLLSEALASGAAATGIDHSEEMVRLARQRAPAADVVLGRAENLPFADRTFTAVAMSIVFLFLPDPHAVLEECYRVLAPGGRVAIYTTAPELRGTPAVPEPVASCCFFYEDDALSALARTAGFEDVAVHNEQGGQLLTGRRPSLPRAVPL